MFKARYHGECGQGDHIYPGDDVMYDLDDELVHESCVSKEAVVRAKCPDCNMIHAGECW